MTLEEFALGLSKQELWDRRNRTLIEDRAAEKQFRFSWIEHRLLPAEFRGVERELNIVTEEELRAPYFLFVRGGRITRDDLREEVEV